MKNPQKFRETSQNVLRQNIGGHYLSPQFDQVAFQQINRPNDLIRQSPVYPQYGHQNIPSVYQQQSFTPQPHYQPLNHVSYQPHVQQPYNLNYYPNVLPQNYAPLYPGSMTNAIYNLPRKNIAEQSINSNFSYENANFDCNYSV